MKKTFLFLAAALMAVSVNAETIFSWSGKVGAISLVGNVEESTVKINTNTTSTPSLKFSNGYSINKETLEHSNYAEITIDGGFKTGDVIKVEFCFSNSDGTKKAAVGIYNKAGEEIAASGNGINARTEDGLTAFNYELKADMDTIRIARAKVGNTATHITTLDVVRGEEVAKKALNPSFSVASGTYFEPFKLGLESGDEGAKILYRLNETGDYAEYTDSILIDQYDATTVVEAYATLEGAENSDVVKNSYTLKHFVARPIFNYRECLTLSGITQDDIQVLSGDNVKFGTYTMDGVACPSVDYIQMKNTEGTDSLMILGFAKAPGLTLQYKNSEGNKANVIKCAANFLQLDSKNFEVIIDNVNPGDTIVIVATNKGSAPTKFSHTYSSSAYLDPYQPEDDEDPCFTDGDVYTEPGAKIENDYSGWTNLVYTVQEGRHKVKVKETNGGARIAKILVGAYRGELTAVENVETEQVKAQKVVLDGQIYILKDGKRFNILGAEVK